MADKQPARRVSIWVKAFVAFHIVCITMWALPYPKQPYMNGMAKFGVDTSSPATAARTFSETLTEGALYFNWKFLKGSPLMYYPGVTGFWQFWDMFSPNPANVDLYLVADVTFRDGSKQRFDFPRIYKLSIPLKYLKERYRKFYENANSDSQAYIRPSVAQRIALECFVDPHNPPVQVVLIRNFDTVEPPDVPVDPEYTVVPFFTYQVDQARLRRDKGFAE